MKKRTLALVLAAALLAALAGCVAPASQKSSENNDLDPETAKPTQSVEEYEAAYAENFGNPRQDQLEADKQATGQSIASDWSGDEPEQLAPEYWADQPAVESEPETTEISYPFNTTAIEYGNYFYFTSGHWLCRTTTEMTDYEQLLFMESDDARIVGLTSHGNLYISSQRYSYRANLPRILVQGIAPMQYTMFNGEVQNVKVLGIWKDWIIYYDSNATGSFVYRTKFDGQLDKGELLFQTTVYEAAIVGDTLVFTNAEGQGESGIWQYDLNQQAPPTLFADKRCRIITTRLSPDGEALVAYRYYDRSNEHRGDVSIIQNLSGTVYMDVPFRSDAFWINEEATEIYFYNDRLYWDLFAEINDEYCTFGRDSFTSDAGLQSKCGISMVGDEWFIFLANDCGGLYAIQKYGTKLLPLYN